MARERKILPPVAFLSYVHSDDSLGRVSKFREYLCTEVTMALGEEFRIFQDRNDIAWGQHWRERIEKAISTETTFLGLS